jgi:hypothetical protein
MGKTRSKHGEWEMNIKLRSEGLKLDWLGKSRRRRGEDVEIVLAKTVREIGDWIQLVHDRIKWRNVVTTIMSIGVHETQEISWQDNYDQYFKVGSVARI